MKAKTISNSENYPYNGQIKRSRTSFPLENCTKYKRNRKSIKYINAEHEVAPQFLRKQQLVHISPTCHPTVGYRMQWSVVNDSMPRCKKRTTIQWNGKEYIFDGFILICHKAFVTVPEFNYVRDNVPCRIRLVKEPFPRHLLLENDPLYPVSLSWVQKFIFGKILQIHPNKLFEESGSNLIIGTCSGFHFYPRFVSFGNDDVNIDPTNIGFLDGEILDITSVALSLEKSCRPFLSDVLKENCFMLHDHLIMLKDKKKAVRIDRIAIRNEKDPVNSSSIRHESNGSVQGEGVLNMKKVEKWRKKARLLDFFPSIGPYSIRINPNAATMTGLRTDLPEVASALPILLKFIRHFQQLQELESKLSVKFKNKTALREAFTHVSYVDLALQSSNSLDATYARVSLGHVFMNYPSTGGQITNRIKIPNMKSAKLTQVSQSISIEAVHDLIRNCCLDLEFDENDYTGEIRPYERLEFLGDAILSYMVTHSLFLKKQKASEHLLHKSRSNMVNNVCLGAMGVKFGLHKYILSAFETNKLPMEVKYNIIADTVEALIGALFLDQGLDACHRFYGMLLEGCDSSLVDSCWYSKVELEEVTQQYVDRDDTVVTTDSRYRERHREFTVSTGIVIHNGDIWLQAFTHKSMSLEDKSNGHYITDDPNYERIEFLGDAVLQFLTSKFLVENMPIQREDLLTRVRSSLVNNERLARIAQSMHFDYYLRLGSQLGLQGATIKIRNYLADTFEAVLGALFLEKGINEAENFLKQILFPCIKEALLNREWINPKSRLDHYLRLWSIGYRQSLRLIIRNTQRMNINRLPMHNAYVYIEGHLVARASAPTILEANRLGAKKALLMYGHASPPY